MANGLTLLIFFLLGFLVLSTAQARAVPAASTLPESDPFASSSSASNIPVSSLSSLEESSLDDEDDCNGLKREECLIKRSMVAHTDYIYTQDISSNGP